ncbi:hypothetical protein J5N97_003801 [Dioscorea zingiberensis]|uniref:Transcription repressor n=1 Tax=Dioscorea zingiberensis TaxID=325984 RepID=A0A9D5D4U9_9LILI|nr:hypothetical protein J5N97_003801 [Dioscorea zingiberensis]
MIRIPCFYKLKDMSTRNKNKSIKTSGYNYSTTSPPKQISITPRRASHYYSTRQEAQKKLPSSPHTHSPLDDSPRKSKRRARRKPKTDQSSKCNQVLDSIPDLQLPPIITKPAVNNKAHRLRVRTKSPRVQVCMTKMGLAMAQSLAIVKLSSNPQKDFKDSMMEMIVENNIRAPGDLEELLASYLSLNSYEYHSMIVKVFEQIWLNLGHS